MTVYEEDNRGVMLRFPARTKEFSPLQNAHHGSVTRPAFRVTGTGGVLFGSKAAGK